MLLQRPAFLVAHTPPSGSENWDGLDAHLLCVARAAKNFAEAFGGGYIAYLAGLLHDLGKCNPVWQDYLWNAYLADTHGSPKPSQKIPHAIWGAAFAYLLWQKRALSDWEELSLSIQGHHSGLHSAETSNQDFAQFITEHHGDLAGLGEQVLKLGIEKDGALPRPKKSRRLPTDRELFARMLFSALVDADYLATETHMRPESAARRGNPLSIDDLVARFGASAFLKPRQTDDVQRVRDDVYRACIAAARQEPGLFRLTVPTGGGKTRSALAFALEHAKRHGLRRVVVALPYTSIIDQNAAHYRAWLGDDAVLEHHSALAPTDDENAADADARARLAIENWDAPVIVTTTVQLFESLFGDRPSKVRKLHRLARSVIVLDEIQAFPTELLRPAIDALKFLATPVADGGCGASVVFCTATQPAFERGPLAELIPRGVTEIVPNYGDYFRVLRRVNYEIRSEPQTWEEIAEEIRTLDQVLVVVNTRKDALQLLELLRDGSIVFHLSTLLCGAHRRAVLTEVTRRLRDGEPVKLISTQVVECGVDLDFPIAYRAMGPLDRIVQTAGRVNRHGLREELGKVIVFIPADGRMPFGPYKTGTEKAKLLLLDRDPEELHTPELHEQYFDLLHRAENLDKRNIQRDRETMDYPAVAEKFRLIDADTSPVLVRYGGWRAAFDRWQHAPSRDGWRRLQPYLVNVFQHDLQNLEGYADDVGNGLRLWNGPYDATTHRGIVTIGSDPSDLFV